jgi:hypothetical protein
MWIYNLPPTGSLQGDLARYSPPKGDSGGNSSPHTPDNLNHHDNWTVTRSLENIFSFNCHREEAQATTRSPCGRSESISSCNLPKVDGGGTAQNVPSAASDLNGVRSPDDRLRGYRA